MLKFFALLGDVKCGDTVLKVQQLHNGNIHYARTDKITQVANGESWQEARSLMLWWDVASL